jgi:hypothetical protein
MEGTKLDSGKLRWDLLPLSEVSDVVEVYTRGAAKYGDNNWKLVVSPIDRYFAALMRHLVAWRSGERVDCEWGTHHLAHVIWNAIALLYFDKQEAKRGILEKQGADQGTSSFKGGVRQP